MTTTLEIADSEVSSAFQQARGGGLQAVMAGAALQLQTNAVSVFVYSQLIIIIFWLATLLMLVRYTS